MKNKPVIQPAKAVLFLLLLAAFTSRPFSGNAQTAEIDSLIKVVNGLGEDTNRVNVLVKLAASFIDIDKDKTIAYAEDARQLSVKLKFKAGEAKSLKWLAYGYDLKGFYFQALDTYSKALTAFEIIDDKDGYINILNNFGAFFSDNGEDTKAGELVARSLALAEELGSKQRIENALGNLGVLYSKNPETTDKAIIYYTKALPLALELKNMREAGLLSINLSESYNAIKRYDSALYFGKKAFEYFGSSSEVAWAYTSLGKLYTSLEKYDSAIIYFRGTYDAGVKGDSKLQMARAFNGIANAYYLQQKNKEAVAYFLKALTLLKEVYALPELKECYKGLGNTYRQMGNMELAYRYERLLNELIDVEYEHKKKFNTAILEYTIELQKQTGQIAQLKKANEQQQLNLEREKFAKNTSIAGLAFLLVFAFLLLRNIRQRKRLNQILYKQKEEIQIQKQSVETTLTELKSTQSQLIHAEKMASLGELTAGIAHEIQNPLNFVNNFSEVSTELLDEMATELENGNKEDALAIAEDVKGNLEKILFHGKRADGIVKGMLQHSRTNNGLKEPTRLNTVADEYLKLAYHGLRAKDKSFNATLNSNFDESITTINVVAQDIGRVILNLITNAFYAVNERLKTAPDTYKPTVSVTTKKKQDKILITVSDNGNGIPQKVLDKIFQPFFTTKPTGEGTGLGLSLSYDIIKAHGGEIKVESKEGQGATFTIELPAGPVTE